MQIHAVPSDPIREYSEPWPFGPLMVDIQYTRPRPISRRRRARGFWLDLGASLAIAGMCAAFGLAMALV